LSPDVWVCLDAQANPPRPFPKIPAKLLQDFSPRGALYVMGRLLHEWLASKNMKNLTMSIVYRKEVNVCFPVRSEAVVCG
jgi:hypothetical protein